MHGRVCPLPSQRWGDPVGAAASFWFSAACSPLAAGDGRPWREMAAFPSVPRVPLLSRLVLLLALALWPTSAAGAQPVTEMPAGAVGARILSASAASDLQAPLAALEHPRCTAVRGEPASESADDCTDPIRRPLDAARSALRAGARVTLRPNAPTPPSARVPGADIAARPAALAALDETAAVHLGAFPRSDAGTVPGGLRHLPYLPTAPPRRA